MSQKREVDKIIRDYRRRGWQIERTGSGHWRFTPPGGGRFVIASNSPSNMIGVFNIRADLKRCERRKAVR